MQIDPGLYQRLAAYNAWMTDKAYVAADQMSDAERKQDRGAFFKSVHSTLNHILFADRVWMSRFFDKSYKVNCFRRKSKRFGKASGARRSEGTTPKPRRG